MTSSRVVQLLPSSGTKARVYTVQYIAALHVVIFGVTTPSPLHGIGGPNLDLLAGRSDPPFGSTT